MDTNNIYFEDVLSYGNLYIDKVLFSYDNLPIVFVCKNLSGKLLLSVCTDSIMTMSWMLIEVSKQTLVKVIKNEIPDDKLPSKTTFLDVGRYLNDYI